MIDGMPQPPLLAFAAHKAPHLIHLGGINLPTDDVNLWRIKAVEQPCVHLLDGRRFFFNDPPKG
jgi:hypothetical protein